MAMHVIQGMCSNARSGVQVNGQYSNKLGVGVGVRQGSVLSALFFIFVMEVLSCESSTGVPWEHLYADDLVLITDTQKECISKLKAWTAGIENKGFRVNRKKTKSLVSDVGQYGLKKSDRYPYVTCCSGFGNISLECNRLVYKRCSGIIGRLVANPNCVCRMCNDGPSTAEL